MNTKKVQHFAFCLCYLHFALFLTSPFFLFAQQSPTTLLPGKNFTNHSPDTLILLPKQKLQSIMDRDETSKELIQSLQARTDLCDSSLNVKSAEAENWYGKLLETDRCLEDLEIKNVRRERRQRIFNKLWFGAGVLVGWVVWGVM